jgi:cytochrome P450
VSTPVAFDPFRVDHIADPYPFYAELRRSQPVSWNERLNGWLIARYDDVRLVLKDAETYVNRLQWPDDGRVREMAPWHSTEAVNRSDRPRHTEMRSLITEPFKRNAIEAHRHHVEEVVDELVDAALQTDVVDIVRDIASPLPKQMIIEMLGLPPIDHDQFQQWTDDSLVFVTPETGEAEAARIAQSNQEFIAYARRAVDEYSASGSSAGLMASLVDGRDRGILDDDQLASYVLLMLVGGNETTTGVISFSVLSFLRNPDQLELLLERPDLIPGAVEECLRWDGSVTQYSVRAASRRVELHGQTIEYGDLVLPLLPSANRDSDHFEDADRFDITRRPNDHLSFSTFIHSCIGAPLTRLELAVFLERALPRLRGIELAIPEDQLSYRASPRARGLHALPVKGSW